jgi:hypothetical protein
MNEMERRLRELVSRLTAWWHGSAKNAARDFRDSERGQRAAGKLNDLRTSGTAKKAEAAFNDLRGSGTAKKAESALSDLRQREPVKKAEKGARKVVHDLFSGSGSGGSTGSGPAS